eukprot:TRINITY_DN11417_c0_g3_i3.p3 TRINITY_DN11417_c0_g3~~TRINITY_DN11417_c0_g3_i3.p3  ORF type:complete len:183 (-),score=19.69 TRINITY_DN11417_c0_g3_i3:1077-1589(-)
MAHKDTPMFAQSNLQHQGRLIRYTKLTSVIDSSSPCSTMPSSSSASFALSSSPAPLSCSGCSAFDCSGRAACKRDTPLAEVIHACMQEQIIHPRRPACMRDCELTNLVLDNKVRRSHSSGGGCSPVRPEIPNRCYHQACHQDATKDDPRNVTRAKACRVTARWLHQGRRR